MRVSPQGDTLVRIAGALLRTRWLVRAPIWIYRAGLGAVFGRRLLLLEHTGRSSGRVRRVVLEVVGRTSSGYIVVSGFGERAQWLRNVEADPRVRVQVLSGSPAPARARRLEPEEATAALRRYADRHPRAWARLRPVLEESLGAMIDEDGTNLPVVALEVVR